MSKQSSCQKLESELIEGNHEIKKHPEILLNFIDSVTDGIIIIQDGLIKYSNKSAARMVGHSPDEIIGTPFEKYIHDEDVARFREVYKRRLSGENVPSRYELKVKGADGSTIYLETNSDIVQYQGKTATITIIRDISERKKLLDEIKEKAKLLETILEHAPEAIALYDPSGKVVMVNKKFIELFGYSQEEIKKREAKIVSEDQVEESNMILEKIKKGEKVRIETIRFKKTGDPIEVEITAAPIKEKGQTILTIVIWRDLSKIKKSEREAKKNEERFRVIFEGSRDAIFIADENAKFVEANQAASELTGYSREELLKMRIPDLHEETDLHAYKRYFHRIMGGNPSSAKRKY